MQDRSVADEARDKSVPREAGAAVPTDASGAGTLAIFTATTFLSALLLFSVQPMFAKMVLPILGGAPSVWAVAMLFFQAALLAGYCYAHLLIRVLPLRLSGVVHVLVILAAVVALPIGVPANFGEPPPGEPYFWQLGLFTVAVGLPFFAVSANAPLLQAWFAQSGHRQAADPYFLYGASNLGSLLALLSYPLLLEPTYGLRALSWLWTAGYALLILCICVAVLAVVRARARIPVAVDSSSVVDMVPAAAPGWSARLGWVGLALVPSALLTAFTNHVTMDVASAPLLWVLPLALYLLTFVLVFRERPIVLVPVAVLVGLAGAVAWKVFGERIAGETPTFAAQAIAGGVFALGFFAVRPLLPVTPMGWMRGVHLVAVVMALLALSQTRLENWFVTAVTGVAVFFSATMVAHRTLYEARPAPAHLTEFYLLMSLGGVLGGLFAALIAPKLFSEVFEYPILLALTMACRPGALGVSMEKGRRDELLVLWIAIAGAILAVIWLPQLLPRLPMLDPTAVPGAAWWLKGIAQGYMSLRTSMFEWGSTALVAALLAALLVLAWRYPPRQLVLALGMCAAIVLLPSGVRRSDAERSYFGIYRVYLQGDYNILMHGTTLHGAQKVLNDVGERVVDTSPATYYHATSPMAHAVEIVRAHITKKGGSGRFGVVGLGSGSLACHASEGERWRFFEIDPLMVKIASNPDNFSYLANCQPNPPDIVVGDARLTLAKETADSFDLIIVDAFSSDAVPIHLMTSEALALYLDKVGPAGVAVLHISNRYLDLDSVLGATYRQVPGVQGLIVADDTSDGSYASTSSTIAVFSRSTESLAPFRELGDVRELDSKGLKPWTDDFSDIIGPFLAKLGYYD